MGLQFIGEVGVYFPAREAVKVTALDGDRVVDCYACRSALEALGCASSNGPELIRFFQNNRLDIELAAMIKYRRATRPAIEVNVEAADLLELLPATAA